MVIFTSIHVALCRTTFHQINPTATTMAKVMREDTHVHSELIDNYLKFYNGLMLDTDCLQKKQLHEDMIFSLAMLNEEYYKQLLEIFAKFETGNIEGLPKSKLKKSGISKQNCTGSYFKGKQKYK